VPDPVSWMVIEPGWIVAGREGETLGQVHEVFGDDAADIFNGLVVSPGRLKAFRYVPSERVAAIFEGLVELELDEDEFERLDEHTTAPSA
jgi:uncharacterized protein YrrD